MNMFKVRMLKLKTEIETYLAKLCGVFNKRIKGIKTKYNQNYCGDKHKYHDLDIMCAKDSVPAPHAMEGRDLDIMYSKDKIPSPCAVEKHDVDVSSSSGCNPKPNAVDEHDSDITHSSDGNLKPCVLYMHGGGWCAYDKRVFRSTCKRLCAYGTVVFNCNFRLAPKFSVEDMQQDIFAIIKFISANAQQYGGNPEKIILAGDSSGAHLLSLFINKATLNNDAIAQKVVGCAFFYGAYNLETTLTTGFKHSKIYMSAIVPPSTANYRDRLQELSPINYVSANLPPTFICSGQIDKLNDSQSQLYAQILREKGVAVTSIIFPKEFAMAKHKFITFDTNAATKIALSAFGEFLKTL